MIYNSITFNYNSLFQEELAFVLQMLGLYDEALVQYDELDALFTQFVLNSNVGGIFSLFFFIIIIFLITKLIYYLKIYRYTNLVKFISNSIK